MSGHSKWAQIKHAKAATDKKKGLVFSKLVRQIAIAAREGGPDPATNFKLRLAVEKAREAEMPKDNIDRAVQKAAGGEDGNRIEQVTYEGFGPFGTTFIIEAATDSKNRTTANVRHILELFGGGMGQPGSVAWSFETKGQILVPKGDYNPEDIELAAIDAGAEDVRNSDEGIEIYTAPLDLKAVRQAIENLGIKIAAAEITMLPKNAVDLSADQKKKVQGLYDALSEDDDVVAVYASAAL